MNYNYGNDRLNKFIELRFGPVSEILCIYCRNNTNSIKVCYLNSTGELRYDYYTTPFYISHTYISPSIKKEACSMKLLGVTIDITKLFLDHEGSILYLGISGEPYLAAPGTFVLDYTNVNFDILDQI